MNLITLNCLFKPQFKESLINEFLAFHFFNKCKFFRDVLITEGKKIISVSTRTARDVIIHLKLSLMKREVNHSLLPGSAAACRQENNVEAEDTLPSAYVLTPAINPDPRFVFTPHLPPPSVLISSYYQKFHECKKFHWLHSGFLCDPTRSQRPVYRTTQITATLKKTQKT